MKITDIIATINATNYKSAWNRGVAQYALDLLQDLHESGEEEYTGSPYDHRALLNGASCWQQYSDGGCALCYNVDIAARLCNPSELRRTNYGERNPNSRENWLDCQARALWQAERLINSIVR